MTALWILLGIVAFFALLLSFSITVYVSITDEVKLSVGAFGYKKQIQFEEDEEDETETKPETIKKPKKHKKKRGEPSPESPPTDKKPTEKSFSETVSFAVTLIKSILPGSVRMLKHLRICQLRLIMTVTGESADRTAIAYGGISTGIYTLLGVLDNTFKLQIKEIDLRPDFVSDESHYDISFKVKLRLVHILFGGIGIFFKFLGNTMKQKSNSNGNLRK